MYYFSYGSNMSTRRLLARTPSATAVDTALLRGHRLMFHKASLADGSAKCDAYATGVNTDFIHGVLYTIDASEKPILDRVEGLGIGYAETQIAVETGSGAVIQAFSYKAIHITSDVQPFTWYKEHVLRGACEFGLPEAYIAMIEAVEAIMDHDRERHNTELAIYKEPD